MAAIMEMKERLWHKDLTMEDVLGEAQVTRPSNDLMLDTEDATIKRCIHLKEMSVLKFWDNMKENREFRAMFGIANWSFPGLHSFAIDHRKAQAKESGELITRVRPLPRAF